MSKAAVKTQHGFDIDHKKYVFENTIMDPAVLSFIHLC